MEEKKYLLLSLEDARAKSISEVLGSKVCKQIIDCLAEKEMSENDLSEKLRLPINTIEYNLKKLLSAELIEKSKSFFWSKKGKKIIMYSPSNKSIIISPNSSKISSKIKSILPAVFVSAIGGFLVKYFFSLKESSRIVFESKTQDTMLAGAANALGETYQISVQNNSWIWFLAGAGFALLIFLITNRKNINERRCK